MKELLIIIPAYNEEKSIERVVKNITMNFPQYDYVIVNDGSKDKTGKVCRKNHFNYIDLPVNLGLAGAFQTGLKYAYRQGYEYALQYDGDGQHKVEYVDKLLKEMKNGSDTVIGSRFVEKKKPATLRMLGSRLISGAIWLTTGKHIKDPTSGMRMYNRALLKECAVNLNYGPEPDTISYLIKQGVKITEVQVEMDERLEGESYLNFSRSMAYMLRMVISILFVQSFRKRDKKYVKADDNK